MGYSPWGHRESNTTHYNVCNLCVRERGRKERKGGKRGSKERVEGGREEGNEAKC